MGDIKTQPTAVRPLDFIELVEHPVRKENAKVLLEVFSRVTGEAPVMWGSSIIGYGEYTYTPVGGKPQKFMRSGFSPRKQNLSLYIMLGFDKHPDLLEKLGKHKHGKSCLYINKLADVDMAVLEQLIESDWQLMSERYPD